MFDGRFAPPWRLYSPGRRLEAAVVEHARRGPFGVLDWMSSVAPEKLVASTWADPRWAVTAAGDPRPGASPGAAAVRVRRAQSWRPVSGGAGEARRVTVLSSALTAAAALPYILDIVRGRAKPRIASWGIWAVVQAVGTASAFAAGQLPEACYTLLCAAGCAAVVVLGWRHGSRDFGPLDAVCVTLAAEGVALLAVAALVPGLIPDVVGGGRVRGHRFPGLPADVPPRVDQARTRSPGFPTRCSARPRRWSCSSPISGSSPG